MIMVIATLEMKMMIKICVVTTIMLCFNHGFCDCDDNSLFDNNMTMVKIMVKMNILEKLV